MHAALPPPQAALNYEEAVTGRPAVAPLGQRTCVEHILLTQRDATLCASLAAAASSSGQALDGAPSAAASSPVVHSHKPHVPGPI